MRFRPIMLALVALCFQIAGVAQVFAHEFWIMPERFEIQSEEELVVNLLEGDEFKGKSIAYHSRRFHIFDVLTPTKEIPIKNSNDADPAAILTMGEPGLHVLRYQSKLGLITYESMSKFERFLKKMKLDWAIEAHQERNLPTEKVREAYFRYAKALVQVGNAKMPTDRLVGMPLELVALDNPYDDLSTIRLQLHYKKEIYPNQPIFVFHRSSQGVQKQWFESDKDGMIEIALDQPGEYQVNAVHMQPASQRMNSVFGAVWQTLWASMTFAVNR